MRVGLRADLVSHLSARRVGVFYFNFSHLHIEPLTHIGVVEIDVF